MLLLDVECPLYVFKEVYTFIEQVKTEQAGGEKDCC
jgi:hypothetical protein